MSLGRTGLGRSGSWFKAGLIAVVLLTELTSAAFVPHIQFGLTHGWHSIPLVFAAILLLFSGSRIAATGLQRFPVRYGFFAANLLFFASFLYVGRLLRSWAVNDPQQIHTWYFIAGTAVWIACFVLLVLTLIAVIIPLREFIRVLRDMRRVWVYAAICAVVMAPLRLFVIHDWDTRSFHFEEMLQHLAFRGTEFVLRLFYPRVISVAPAYLLGTPRFSVLLKGTCSGMEGMVLIGTVTILWILYARRELRMARAMLLIPLSLAVMWTLNIVRLVVLIAIGNAGHPKVALEGFHSAAGWIAFNFVSAIFLLMVHQVKWFRKPEPTGNLQTVSKAGYARNIPAIYLGPFVAIIAASLISAAASSGFEWFYPLRFFAALAVLWMFRREYQRMDWRFGWLGPVAGLGVAALWLFVELKLGWGHPVADSTTAATLAQLPSVARWSWIAVRVLAAVTTVPIAEELAFRGFVARRVSSREPESVPYAKLSIIGIVVSSVLFGAMHGGMWAMGMVAGVVFALVAKMRGRLGEAVAAHAVANLVIAVVAIRLHDYSLW